MGEFVNRVSNYPVVGDTCKAATDAYNWVKTKETLNPMFSKLESAAASLAVLVKPVVDSNLAHQLDDVACHQLLDRFETLCPTLKENSTEEILGPVANRALNLAETCANYCLPEDKCPSQENSDELSRIERISRIRTRATHQAISLFHSSIGRARDLLTGVVDSGLQLAQVVPTASIGATLTQVISILNFACGTAKAVGIPLIVQGLNLAKEQTEKLNTQLKESNTLNWLDLNNIISGLDKLRALIEKEHEASSSGDEEKPGSADAVVKRSSKFSIFKRNKRIKWGRSRH